MVSVVRDDGPAQMNYLTGEEYYSCRDALRSGDSKTLSRILGLE